MKKIAQSLIFLSLIVLSCQGCDVIYRLLDKKGAEEKELVGDVIPLEKNSAVEEIQTLLKLYGYNPGPIDGVMGVRTRNAVEKFQTDHGLEETRFVDQDTWAKLKVFLDSDFIANSRLNVHLIQEILEKEGFGVGKIDGKFGPKTKQAVEDFQKVHDLKIDGKVGYWTLTALSDVYVSHQNPSPQAILE